MPRKSTYKALARTLKPLAKFFIVLNCLSCTVKPDRLECPSLLQLKMEGGGESAMQAFLSQGSGAVSLLGSLQGQNGSAQGDFEIAKGQYALSVVSGLHDSVIEEDAVLSDPCGYIDELFVFASEFEASSELTRLEGCLHRQTCYLYLSVAKSSQEDWPFLLRIRSGSIGICLKDLSPVRGTFTRVIHPLVGEHFRLCLPRQCDNALTLEFLEGSDSSESISDVIPLGEIIAQAGYDWTAEDLDDIHVSIDFSDVSVSAHVLPWDQTQL